MTLTKLRLKVISLLRPLFMILLARTWTGKLKTGFYLDHYYLHVFETTDYCLSKGVCKNPEERKPEDEDYEPQLYIFLGFNFFFDKNQCLDALEKEKCKKTEEFATLCLNYINSLKLLT